LAAPEKRLLEEAEIGDAVATGGVMEAINFGPQAAAYLIEKVCNGGVIRGFSRPRQVSNTK
jgi:hypothetical protein